MIFLAHILACYLIILGKDDEDQIANDLLWIANNQGLWIDSNDIPEYTLERNMWAVYIFSYYWIWEVITTVGYGDRSVTMNRSDVLFTLAIEFIGLIMQAIMINVMANFVEGNSSFTALVNAKL